MTASRITTLKRLQAKAALPHVRPVPERFTAQQAAFITAVRDDTNHLMLRATAGSGKTTTLTEAAWHLPPAAHAVYFAFNKHSVDGIASNLPRHVRAATLHAYGRRVLCRARQDPQLQVDEKKSERLAQSLAASLAASSGERPDFKLIRATARLWNAAREQTLDHTSHEDDLAALAVQVEWPGDFVPRVLRGALKSMRSASLTDFGSGGLPDFTDFLWLPLELKLEANSLTVALVDECQDLTPLRQQFMIHLLGLGATGETSEPHGRLVAVGDSAQAIYAYAGADPLGMERLTERLGATRLPLSLSFRCPASHVQLAHRANTFIESAEDAKPGVVEHLSAEELTYRTVDVVLSRLNSPLIQTALKLLAREISVNIRGRDLAARLEAAAQETFPKPYTADTIKDLVKLHYDKKAKPFTARAKEGDREAKKILTDLKDICACLRILAERAVTLSERSTVTVNDLARLLRSLYRDDADVLFSTVHRAKGLEWDRVTLLYPDTMPYPAGEYQEEMCVLFVALTRSKDTLRLAYGKEAWAGRRFLLPPQAEQDQSAAWEEQGPLPFDPQLDLDQDAFLNSTDAASGPLDFSLRPLTAQEIDQPFATLPSYPPQAEPTRKPPTSRPQASPAIPTHNVNGPGVLVPAHSQTPSPPTRTVAQRPSLNPAAPPVYPKPVALSAAAKPALPHGLVTQTEEQLVGQLMLDALRSLESSTDLPAPPKAMLDQAHAVGVQFRRQEQSTTIDDPRATTLYHGQYAISVTELRLALDSLRSEPRPALREWAETSLVLLRTCNTRFVNIHEQTLRDVERAALQARISVPLLGPQDLKTVPVIVFEGNYSRVRPGKLTRDAPKVRTVTVNGHVQRFDPRTGDPDIPPTNNAAERSLRTVVMARKVSQCSKNAVGAQTYMRIKSAVETARLRGQDPVAVLTSLMRLYVGVGTEAR
ncbi:UvrD-helicase domain-containing protein [Deinococcus altitudinis]|uniref:UvrD-helicase domain-containing protein n=1 Tax=Deinococcus altitudinis TaxID=468914 RepID=UPI0038911ADD